MRDYLSLRDYDWPMFLVVLAICGLGVTQIYSATRGTVWHDSWWKQIIYIAAGIFLMWAVSLVDYHTMMNHLTPLYLVAVGGLLAVLLVGKTVFNSTRWIALPGGIHIQVSEFAKLVIILVVARFMTELRGEVLELPELLRISGLLLVPMLLIAKEPDLSTAVTYVPILVMGIFLAGLRWQYWTAFAILFLLVVPLSFSLLKPYQKDRLVIFLNPDTDPKGTGYQIRQSKIAVGSGGMWGRGVTKGTQTQLRFLPVAHTDFIFSAFSEENGFVGAMAALAFYFVLLMQIVQNAQTAPDRAGMFICMGVAALLLFHILVNVGMVVGRMPVSGIPLPLMSYGGSSIWSTFLMLGLVNNVRLRRFVN
jgi:rod shape determining protein RodA